MSVAYYIIAILVGATLGSFLNVVVFRYPDKPLTGRSYCPKCKKTLTALELIPIISYLIIRGRCTKCQQKISPQYPLVELVISIIAALVFYAFTIDPSNPAIYIVQFFIIYVLVALFLIDLRTFLLPDIHIGILAGLVILNIFLVSGGITPAIIGALVGFGALFFLWIITARRGIGLGDVKLMIPLGFLFGPANTILLLFSSFILGGFLGIILLVTKKATPKTAVPFGPFLTGVAIIYLLFPQIPHYLLSILL